VGRACSPKTEGKLASRQKDAFTESREFWTDALNAAKRQKQAVGPSALSMTDRSFNGRLAVPALLLMAIAQCAERAE
jgi:hypothetical protein